MAQHKSSIKRIRITARKQAVNTIVESKMRTLVKKLKTEKKKDLAETQLKGIFSVLDKLARKGAIHKNKAANQKSKLTKLVSNLK